MTIYGLDVSKFQRGLDLTSVARQGFAFVAAKCTEGQGYADPQYPVFLAAAKRAGLLFSAYHFLRSDSPVSSQAANLAAHIRDRSIPVMIDCEPSGSSRPKIAHVNGFVAECRKRGLRVATLYYPGFWWSQSGKPKLPADLGFWQARYPSSAFAYASVLYPGDKHAGWGAQGGQVPDLFQFASSGKISGYGGRVDVDAFRGTLAQLREARLFKDWTPTPPTPAPVPHPAPVPVPVRPAIDLSPATIAAIADAVAAKLGK